MDKKTIKNILDVYFRDYGDGKKSSIRGVKTMLHTLTNKILDYEDLINNVYTEKELVELCNIYPNRYKLVCTIQKINNPECKETIEFKNNLEFYIEKISKTIDVMKNYKDKLPGKISIVYNLYDVYLNFDQYTAFEIFEVFNNYRKPENKKHILLIDMIDIMKYFIETKDLQKINNLENIYKLYNPYMSTVNLFASESLWRTELINKLRNQARERSNCMSSTPEIAITSYLSKSVNYLRYFEKYVCDQKTPPKNIDCLCWYFETVDIKELEFSIIYISSYYIEPDNTLVKSKKSEHHALSFISHIIPLFKDHIPNYFFFCKAELNFLKPSLLLNKIEDKRIIPPEITRIFSFSELEHIFNHVKDNPRFALIYTLLRETGLRVGALIRLKINHFIDKNNNLLSEANILEKKRIIRNFIISDNIKQKLMVYLNTDLKNIDTKKNRDSWLFPSVGTKISKSGHITSAIIQKHIHGIAKKYGFDAPHIHPHSFRHTIVSNLMANGNKLENVSKFIGHSSISITEKYYWTDEIKNIIPLMTIPWLKNQNLKAEHDGVFDENESDNRIPSIEMAVSLLLLYQSLLTIEQKKTIKEKVPNIEEIIKIICDFSTDSSVYSE